jgi:plastocyanin
MGRLLPALVAALLLLPTGAAWAQAGGKAHSVRIEGMKFVPERIEVAAGDTIVWTNQDFLAHSVTAAAAQVESGDLAQGKSFKFVARRKGEMKYLCRLHPVMQGAVVVK